MPNQIDRLDIELYALIDSCDWDNKENYGAVTRKLVEQIKATILKHYISREEVLGKLPEKLPDGSLCNCCDECGNSIPWETGYNQALSDMRQALTTNVKE